MGKAIMLLLHPDQITIDVATKAARFAWVLIFLNQTLGIAVVLMLGDQMPSPPPQAETLAHWLIRLHFLIAGLMVPLAYFIRNQIYKRAWRKDVVLPAGYTIGNVVFFVIMSCPGGISMVASIFSHKPWPHLIPVIMVLGVVLFNFPNGRPMQPTSPRLGTKVV